MKKWVRKYGMYLMAVAAGAAITPAAIQIAETQRGYKAIGGEFLIIPLFTLAVYFIQGVKQTLMELKGGIKDE